MYISQLLFLNQPLQSHLTSNARLATGVGGGGGVNLSMPLFPLLQDGDMNTSQPRLLRELNKSIYAHLFGQPRKTPMLSTWSWNFGPYSNVLSPMQSTSFPSTDNLSLLEIAGIGPANFDGIFQI